MTYTPKHTTEEYLAWIDDRIAKLNEVINNPCAWGIETEIEYRASLLANRDVLERHHRKGCSECALWEVNDNGKVGHCLTYLDIYNRISEVM